MNPDTRRPSLAQFAAVLATLVDVVVRGRNPAEEEVPTVLFPAKDAEVN